MGTLFRRVTLGMLLDEFDAEKYERTLRSEGWEEGREEGRQEGRQEGEIKINKLGILLTKAGRSEEFLNSLSDRKLQKKLFVEFGLEDA